MKNKKAVIGIIVVFLAVIFIFAACKKKDGIAYVTDENGVTLLDANGEPITVVIETSVVNITDGNGNPVTNANGEQETSIYYKPQQVVVPVTDINRQPVTGVNGEVLTTQIWFPSNPTTTAIETVTVTDSAGNAVTDASGNVVTETTIVSSANESFSKTMGGSSSDKALAVVPASDGGSFALVSGYSKDGLFASVSKTNSTGFAVCKYNKDGSIAWTKAFGADGGVMAQDITSTKDGGVVIVGQTRSSDFVPVHGTEYDAFIMKLDGSGNEVFRKPWGGTSNENYYAVAEGVDGSIFAAGFAYSADGDPASLSIGSGDSKAVIVKYSASGDVQKVQGLGGFGDYISDIAVAKNGDVFAVTVLSPTSTQTQYPKKGYSDAGIFKFNSNLDLQFGKSFGGSGIERFESIAVTNDGGCVIVGSTTSGDGDLGAAGIKNKGGQDAVIAKFSGSGSLVFVKTLAGNNDETFHSVALTSQGYIIAVGETESRVRDFSDIDKNGKNAFAARFDTNGNFQALIGIGGSDEDIANSCCVTASGQVMVAGSTNSTDGDFGNMNPKSDGTNTVAFVRTVSF